MQWYNVQLLQLLVVSSIVKLILPSADEIEVESMTSTMQPSPVHPPAPDTMSEVAPPSLPSEKGGIGGLLGKSHRTTLFV